MSSELRVLPSEHPRNSSHPTIQLRLDPEFTPFHHPHSVGGLEHSKFVFSGGEVSVKLAEMPSGGMTVNIVLVSSRLRSSEDLMTLLMAVDALGQAGVSPEYIHLLLPYIPYARQDRVCAPGEAFSLRVFANLINALRVGRVLMLDAHSDVAPALLDRSVNLSPSPYVRMALETIGRQVLLVSPDSGANKKVHKIARDLGIKTPVVACDKERDPGTGKLSGFRVFSDDLEGKDCLLVDDICDGGRTFLGLAEELRKKNAGRVYLYVTHGIFSAGFGALQEAFDGVFCTNSFSTIPETKKFTQFQIKL